jgi:hypothetical protein
MPGRWIKGSSEGVGRESIKSAVKGLFRPPVGFPLGVHVPADPADHPEDFAHRDAEPLDWLAAIRIEELGSPLAIASI